MYHICFIRIRNWSTLSFECQINPSICTSVRHQSLHDTHLLSPEVLVPLLEGWVRTLSPFWSLPSIRIRPQVTYSSSIGSLLSPLYKTCFPCLMQTFGLSRIQSLCMIPCRPHSVYVPSLTRPHFGLRTGTSTLQSTFNPDQFVQRRTVDTYYFIIPSHQFPGLKPKCDNESLKHCYNS